MGIDTICGDLQNDADVSAAFKGMDAVFHVASRVGIWGNYDDYYRTNVIGTENVIKGCRVNGITKLIYTSTPSVVFDWEDLYDADETTPYSKKFHGHYAKTKAIAEQMVLQANDDKLSTVALRPHLIIGPDDPHLVPRLVDAAKHGKLKIVGTGKNLVDVTYIQNAVDAHVQAFEKLSSQSPLAGQAYFIGQERPVVLWDFINEILSRQKLPPITRKVPERIAFNIGLFFECWYRFFRIKGEPPMTRFVALQFSRSHYFSHQKAKKDFGYEPKISIEQALDLTVRK
jgi:nucleoside-diphosphate-sugar epimerase